MPVVSNIPGTTGGDSMNENKPIRTTTDFYKLSEYIPKGAKNAISADRLATVLGIEKRTLRAEISAHRQNGHLILSSAGKNSGYYFPETAEEVRQFVAEQKKRALTTLKGIKSAQQWLKDQNAPAIVDSFEQMTINEFIRLEE